MELNFCKIHGLGNDFVLIDDMENKLSLSPETIESLCDRHFGIGADGVILARPGQSEGADAFMAYYNSDGTVAEMCGNGIRCLTKFLVDQKIVEVPDAKLEIDTLAGRKHISFTCNEKGELDMVRVEMGQPILATQDIPTTLEATKDGAAVDSIMKTPLGELPVTCVSMGNPHCIVFMDDPSFFEDPDSFDIASIGSAMETDPVFPEKCNIEFVYIRDSGSDSVDEAEQRAAEILMRVWERGCGETLACGTGACATAVAAHISGRAVAAATIKLRGGDLFIELEEDGVSMTGPARESFRGTVEIYNY